MGNVYAILIFLRFFVFELRARMGETDGRRVKLTDRRTDGQARHVIRPIGLPHNKGYWHVDLSRQVRHSNSQHLAQDFGINLSINFKQIGIR